MTSSRKISTRFETPDKSPGFLLWQVTNVWQRRMKKALRETGLTHVQFVLLVSTVWLNNHGENATQVAIGKFSHVNVMMTSQVLRSLEKKNLVSRLKNSGDTRALLITPTEKGSIIADKAIAIVEDADSAFFGILKHNMDEFTEMLRELISSN
ncbi:MAG: MarR family transcriptional regulator [Candidatus Thermoplasmatota archaeon]|nr:MarR family transcriptional regulator [Candidatus Thermoplasmatota archaeon]MCL5988604.1 MarR family transcriptional regulator [Candidatus Thermoplasmatota archaeon]